ncbi:hypothetical protein F4778DRAFT_780952 [Xylariomycetidae sp. FL2044]|nr:hypothetical protein F4778DRAFT_780952 [Xylariomycetidae sp. FL2044]
MSAKQVGALTKAWYQWKALRLPWRRQFLVGLDLQGNTYWEFRERGSSLPSASTPSNHRWRRIVRYPRSTQYSDVRVPPHWHQWLRHQREHAPSLAEQRSDLTRQAAIRQLAAEADARWEAKPSLVDAPGGARGQPVPLLRSEGREKGGLKGEEGPAAVVQGQEGRPTYESAEVEKQENKKKEKEQKDKEKEKEKENQNPWKRADMGGPSETWQPQAWNPTPTARGNGNRKR